jgi:hypothetical protein
MNDIGDLCQEGCMDPEALNYDPYAHIEGDCYYINAPQNLVATGGDYQIGLTWDEPLTREQVDLSVSNYNEATGQLEIYMVNQEPVGGFQFDLDSTVEGFTVTSANGGTAGGAGFVMSTNAGGLVLGFSFSGATIPAGEGVLCYVTIGITGDAGEFSISTATISDGSGQPLSTSLGDPYILGGTTITYNIYRDGSFYMGGIEETMYTDAPLAQNEYHCYTVTAFDGVHESDFSNQDCATAGGQDVYGCTDPLACNYDPDATIDDGSCYYEEM